MVEKIVREQLFLIAFWRSQITPLMSWLLTYFNAKVQLTSIQNQTKNRAHISAPLQKFAAPAFASLRFSAFK